MAFVDWDEDKQAELVVGSDDFAIRVFKGEELIFDINEEAKIRIVKLIRNNIFGYCLENGAYGVYYSRKRLWHLKQKQKVSAMVGMEFEVDGQVQLVVGFENGLIEVRKHRTGDLLHTQKPGAHPIQQLFYYDYRQQDAHKESGQKQLIAVDGEGSVTGFTVSTSIKQFEMEVQSEEKVASDEVLALNTKKIELQNQINQIQEKKKAVAESSNKGDH